MLMFICFERNIFKTLFYSNNISSKNENPGAFHQFDELNAPGSGSQFFLKQTNDVLIQAFWQRVHQSFQLWAL